MKPTLWRLTWVDPVTGESGTFDYVQRAAANGARMLHKARGRTVTIAPVF
jgi:hypothetical protein